MEVSPLRSTTSPGRPTPASRAATPPEASPDTFAWQPLAPAVQPAPLPEAPVSFPAPPASAPPEDDLRNLVTGAQTRPELWPTAAAEALQAIQNGWAPSPEMASGLADGVLEDLSRVCQGQQKGPHPASLEMMIEMQSRAPGSIPADFFSRAGALTFESQGPGRLKLPEDHSHWLVVQYGPDRLVDQLAAEVAAGPLKPGSQTAVLALRSYLPNHLDERLEKRFFQTLKPLLPHPGGSPELENLLRGYRNRLQNEARWEIEQSPQADRLARLQEIVSVSKAQTDDPADAATAAQLAQLLSQKRDFPELSIHQVGEGRRDQAQSSTVALVQQALPPEHRAAGYEAMGTLLHQHKDVFTAWTRFLEALSGTDPLAGLVDARLGVAQKAEKTSGINLSPGAVHVGGVRLRTRNQSK